MRRRLSSIPSEARDEAKDPTRMYFVYILKCADGTLYTGSTNDLKKRVERHQKGQGGRYTRSKGGVALAYSEEHPDRSSALKREAEIKRWPRKKKLDLIHSRKSLVSLA